MRNNVTRMLTARGISFSSHELPSKKLSATEVAQFLSIPSEQVFKTIVFTQKDSPKLILALVAAACQVDPKPLAHALGVKKVSLVSHQKAETLTGLQTGGISPFALLHRNPIIVLDRNALAQEIIHISGGQRDLNLSIRVRDFIELTNPIIARISRR